MSSGLATFGLMAVLASAACYTTDGVLLGERGEMRCNGDVLERLEPDGRGGIDWVLVDDCASNGDICGWRYGFRYGFMSCIDDVASCSGDVIMGPWHDEQGNAAWGVLEDCSEARLFCIDGLDGEVSCEPWPCRREDPERTQLRMTSIEVTAPEGLADPGIQYFQNENIDDLVAQWLFDIDPHGTLLVGVGTPREESGSPELEDLCEASWFSEHSPVEATDVDLDEDRLVASVSSVPLRLCIYDVGG
jgi:hypothetical protein